MKLPIATHIYYLADAKATLLAGADLIAHSVRDVPVDAEFINALKARDVCYSPTLMREVSTFVYGSTPPWVDDPFFLKGVGARTCPTQLNDPKRQEQVRNSNALQAGPAIQGRPRSREEEPEDAVRSTACASRWAPTPARRRASRASSSISSSR